MPDQSRIDALNYELIAAARVNNITRMEAALEQGANIECNHNKRSGSTPFFMACSDNAWDAALWLIGKGAVTTKKDPQGKTPLRCALASLDDNTPSSLSSVVLTLVSHTTTTDDLFMALRVSIMRNNLELASKIIEQGVSINIQDDDGNTILMDICQAYGDMESRVDFLLKSGADMTIKNDNGMTALQLTMEYAEDRWEYSDTDEIEHVIARLQEHEKHLKTIAKQEAVAAITTPTKKPIVVKNHGKLIKGPRPK